MSGLTSKVIDLTVSYAAFGTRRAYGVQVLTLRGSLIAGVVAFLDPGLLPAFGLPAELRLRS